MTGFDKSIERWDWILIIGAILSPMTGLRIAKVGPAEFLCFVWALRNIHIKRHKQVYFCFSSFNDGGYIYMPRGCTR